MLIKEQGLIYPDKLRFSLNISSRALYCTESICTYDIGTHELTGFSKYNSAIDKEDKNGHSAMAAIPSSGGLLHD